MDATAPTDTVVLETFNTPRPARNRNYQRIDGAILKACRQLMKLGAFQPTAGWVAETAEVSVRAVFAHFPYVDELRLAAIDDAETRDAILQRILGADYQTIGAPDEWFERIVRAAVLGSVEA